MSGWNVIIGMAARGFQGPLSNRTCQICWANDATHFCDCQGYPTLFCILCVGTHYGKDLRIIHKAIPIAALGKNPEEYERQNKALKEAVAALRSNLELIDARSQEFDKIMKASIDYISTFRSWWLNKMQTEREALSIVIEEAALEAMNCLDQGGVPVSVLGQVIWTSRIEELQVVRCSVTLPDLQACLQACTSYHNDMQVLYEHFHLQVRLKEAKRKAAEKLAQKLKGCSKQLLLAEIMGEWLKLLKTLRMKTLRVAIRNTLRYWSTGRAYNEPEPIRMHVFRNPDDFKRP